MKSLSMAMALIPFVPSTMKRLTPGPLKLITSHIARTVVRGGTAIVKIANDVVDDLLLQRRTVAITTHETMDLKVTGGMILVQTVVRDTMMVQVRTGTAKDSHRPTGTEITDLPKATPERTTKKPTTTVRINTVPGTVAPTAIINPDNDSHLPTILNHALPGTCAKKWSVTWGVLWALAAQDDEAPKTHSTKAGLTTAVRLSPKSDSSILLPNEWPRSQRGTIMKLALPTSRPGSHPHPKRHKK